MGEGSFHLFQLRRRTMNFEPDEIGHGEQFRERCADVVEMRERAFGVGVTFATKNFVAVDGKLVEEILFLSRRFLDEPQESGSDCLQFPGMHFKIGMNTDEG